jgi:flavin-dependent dehydrogenase
MANAAPVEIVGAGPAGLAAAITLARRGIGARVYERNSGVGCRFHGDFQAIENWTREQDALDELAEIGIEPTFDRTVVREGVFFDAAERVRRVHSARPAFYLVRRGPEPGSLDRALERQALSAGVEIRYDTPCRELPRSSIVASGPCRSDAVDVGYVFETDQPDGVYGAFAERLAPGGYAYLLVSGGRGTVASCLFSEFPRANACLERTVEFFRRKVGLRMTGARHFGGTGNARWPRARRGEVLYAGEAAGFQDALWGFGIRSAVVSGHLAARALADGRPEEYDRLWRDRLGGFIATSLANRRISRWLGEAGSSLLLGRISRADGREYLKRLYAPCWWKRVFAF